MLMFALVALGGAIGSVARYSVTLASAHFLGTGFPWQTLAVNIVGSFLMGLVTGLATTRLELSPPVQIFVTVGVLGGFTTFSSFSLDFIKLLDDHAPVAAVSYMAATLFISCVVLCAGLLLAHMIAA